MARGSKVVQTTTAGRQEYFADMLHAEDKWLSKSGNFLTLAARKIMKDMNLQVRQHYALIERWLTNRFRPTKETAGKIAMERNNFYSEVTRHDMTANNFQRFTQSLGAAKVSMTITLEFNDGRAPHTSKISFINNLGPVDENEDNEDIDI